MRVSGEHRDGPLTRKTAHWVKVRVKNRSQDRVSYAQNTPNRESARKDPELGKGFLRAIHPKRVSARKNPELGKGFLRAKHPKQGKCA